MNQQMVERFDAVRWGIRERYEAEPTQEMADRAAEALREIREWVVYADNTLGYAEQFLTHHDAFLRDQSPEIAFAMKEAADAFRSALVSDE